MENKYAKTVFDFGIVIAILGLVLGFLSKSDSFLILSTAIGIATFLVLIICAEFMELMYQRNVRLERLIQVLEGNKEEKEITKQEKEINQPEKELLTEGELRQEGLVRCPKCLMIQSLQRSKCWNCDHELH